VLGAAGIAVGHLGVGVAPIYALVLVFALMMGASDGVTMVAEQGIMQRRTPDAVRSRVLAAFDAVLSLGLAFAYIVAGPVLAAIGPQKVYLIGGIAAVVATAVLYPLRHLAPVDVTRTEAEIVEAAGGLEIERAIAPPY